MISIITVCFNAKADLDKTLKSIAQQSGNIPFEVIVIDGGSNDGSQEMVKNTFENIVDVMLSEQDKGIYDAMNKGIKLASHDWIYFLNAGDCFASNNVLEKLADTISKHRESNFIYAPYQSNDIIDNTQKLSIKYLSAHMINHQSILFKKELFAHSLYDSSYRFCADYAHLLLNFDRLLPVKTEFVIAVFDSTGVSSSEHNKMKMWQERLKAIWSSGLAFTTKVSLSQRAFFSLPYHFIKKLIH